MKRWKWSIIPSLVSRFLSCPWFSFHVWVPFCCHYFCSYVSSWSSLLPSGKPIFPSPMAAVFPSLFFMCPSLSSSKGLSVKWSWMYTSVNLVLFCRAPSFPSSWDQCIGNMNFWLTASSFLSYERWYFLAAPNAVLSGLRIILCPWQLVVSP